MGLRPDGVTANLHLLVTSSAASNCKAAFATLCEANELLPSSGLSTQRPRQKVQQ